MSSGKRKNLRTLSDKSSPRRSVSVVPKCHSVYLKKYAKGVTHRRHPKKLFVIPVVHVSRRPDNPFNVKNAVQNLRTKQMTSTSSQPADTDRQSLISDRVCYSNREPRVLGKSRNWESIRYKYQLDYKEKLKMERENFLKEYGNMKKKLAHKQQQFQHIRSHYQNMDAQMKEVPHNAVAPNSQLTMISQQRMLHRNIDETQNVCKPSSEAHTEGSAFSGRSIASDEPMKFYNCSDDVNNICESVDLTTDYEKSISDRRSELKKMRLVRSERENSIHSEINNNKKSNDATQREDFDFTIPYKESNILIKVMAPDTRNPINLDTQQPGTVQDTLQYDAEPKQEFGTPKRVSFDEETKANNNRPDPGSGNSGNKWLQYLQNILNRTCDPQTEYFNKKLNFDPSKTIVKSVENPPLTTVATSREYARPIQITAPVHKPKVIKVSTAGNFQPTNQIEPSSSVVRIKENRPSTSNPRVIKPQVLHPSPYFRSDAVPNNSQHYNVQLEDPIVTMPVLRHSPVPLMPRHSPVPMIQTQLISRHSPTQLIRRHSPAPLIRDQPNLPRHMEYVYGNHPNYHHEFMLRSNRLPPDILHSNPIGPRVYSYDEAYLHYRNEMERIPQPPFTDPYIHQRSMPIPPLNRTMGFLPPRPAVPGVYRYLSPPQIHPVWIYPHILER